MQEVCQRMYIDTDVQWNDKMGAEWKSFGFEVIFFVVFFHKLFIPFFSFVNIFILLWS